MPNVFSHPYKSDESINFQFTFCWVVFFIFIQILKETSVSKQSRTCSALFADVPKKDARLNMG